MTGMDEFRAEIDEIMRRAEEDRQQQLDVLEAKQQKFHNMLQLFDRHADAIQDQIIAPRVRYLASLFEHSGKPVMEEEEEYRHRIRLRFFHTEEFPCTSDITILIMHCDFADFFKVKFEYIILPIYVTDQYKFEDEIQVAMDEKSYPAVGTFLQNCIETFLMHYLKARKV